MIRKIYLFLFSLGVIALFGVNIAESVSSGVNSEALKMMELISDTKELSSIISSKGSSEMQTVYLATLITENSKKITGGILVWLILFGGLYVARRIREKSKENESR